MILGSIFNGLCLIGYESINRRTLALDKHKQKIITIFKKNCFDFIVRPLKLNLLICSSIIDIGV